MKRTKIKSLIESTNPLEHVHLKGWIRTRRDSKTFSFLEINDGSCLKNIQVIADESLANYENQIKKLNTGSALAVTGRLVESKGGGQRWEVRANQIEVISQSPDSFPLQKKRHSDEYLRSIAHLRPRTNKYGAVFRIRSELAYGIHRFFHEKDFRYVHTPIITGSDCEGAGELFRITTLDLDHLKGENLPLDNGLDFFGKKVNLTVSGQLSAEMLSLALGDVYTFGPTFRAENSNTRRHVAEFWMVEPEMAFSDLSENMDLAEEIIKYLTLFAVENCSEDLDLFSRFVDKNLSQRLKNTVDEAFERLPYHDAIEIIINSKKKFQFEISFGQDLQSEHEKFLTETYFKKPVIIYDYPRNIKPFYMRLNEDQKTVGAMDVLLPEIGEIIGGSQREERLDVLQERMAEAGLSPREYWWYLDSRRFGSVPHSGFGLGFERMIMFLTGINNIRDVIPFPRTPKQIDF
ncbi:MAG: asparagine--tRNA ligase [Desulfobacteraceae bacterium]|jgi:asparaginyl-tRNA synthetase